MLGKEAKMRFAVSTATFTDTNHPKIKDLKNLKEVADAVQTCRQIPGLGIEYVWRKGSRARVEQILGDQDLVLTVHAPIWSSYQESFQHGWQETGNTIQRSVGTAKDVFVSAFLYGVLNQEFDQNVAFTQDHRISKIVVHPGGVKYLAAAGKIPDHQTSYPEILVEPDSRRFDRVKPWVWRREDVLDLVKQTNTAIAFDLSHTIIAQNSLDLRTPYEFYKDGENKRIKVIHLNASFPNPETGIPDIEDRGCPVQHFPKVFDAIKELFQQLKKDQFDGILVFEYFNGLGKNHEDKTKIIYDGLNRLLR